MVTSRNPPPFDANNLMPRSGTDQPSDGTMAAPSRGAIAGRGTTGAAGRMTGERLQLQSAEGIDRAADAVRAVGPPAGAGGPRREVRRRQSRTGGQRIEVLAPQRDGKGRNHEAGTRDAGYGIDAHRRQQAAGDATGPISGGRALHHQELRSGPSRSCLVPNPGGP